MTISNHDYHKNHNNHSSDYLYFVRMGKEVWKFVKLNEGMDPEINSRQVPMNRDGSGQVRVTTH